MTPPVNGEPGSQDVEDEIRSLEEYCDQLAEAIDEFEHEARRCRDRLERAGGASHDLARELKRLEDNRRFSRRELERARQRLDELREISRNRE